MRRNSTLITPGVVVLWITTIVGCGDGLGLVPVEGTVTLDSKPVAGVSVMFTPIGQGMLATGETDDGGRFSLRTANRSGAGIGEYSVTLNKSTTRIKQMPNSPAPVYERVHELPQKYARSETSELTENVSADDSANVFNYDLKSK